MIVFNYFWLRAFIKSVRKRMNDRWHERRIRSYILFRESQRMLKERK